MASLLAMVCNITSETHTARVFFGTRFPEFRKHLRCDLPRRFTITGPETSKMWVLLDLATRLGCIQTGTILIFLPLLCRTEVGFGECI
jgi:hypothetical protein